MIPLSGCLPCLSGEALAKADVLMFRIVGNKWSGMEPLPQYHIGAVTAISFLGFDHLLSVWAREYRKKWARLIQKIGACTGPDPGNLTR
jgi:hypothetical protein